MTTRAARWSEPVPQFAREELQSRMDRVLAEIGRAIQQPDDEAVHDLRVSIRRFSQALRAFASVLPGKGSRKIRARLRVVLDAAAVVRDLDVGLELLRDVGVDDEDALTADMRAKRKRAELFLVGQICLLRAEDLENDWLARLGWSAS